MGLPIKELLNIGKVQLEQSGDMDAAIDAKTLYCYLKCWDSSQFLLKWQYEANDDDCEKFFKLIEQRASGIPTQYITSSQDFMGLTFYVNDKVLIPRQDTETMVEDAVGIIENGTLRDTDIAVQRKSWDVLDLCTGSGAIGISLAKVCKKRIKVTASDISKEALGVARKNQDLLQTPEVRFVESDLFQSFKGKLGNKKFDLIISNPPYVRSDIIPTLQREVKDHEPMKALDGGEDGLDFYRTIADQAADYLNKGGIIMLEIGCDQGQQVMDLFQKTSRFEKISCLEDLAHRDRIVVAKLNNKTKKELKAELAKNIE